MALGHGFTASAGEPFQPAIFRTPGYPAFLAAVYAVFGHSVRAGFLANGLVDLMACALAWRLAARIAGERAGLWTLALAVTYPFTIHSAASISPESMLMPLAVAFVALLARWPREGIGAPVVLTGVVLAALAWVKPVFLPVPAFLILWERSRGLPWRASLVRPVVTGVVAIALFAPWILRNQREFGRPVLAGELGLVVWHGTRDFGPRTRNEIQRHFDKAAKKAPEERYAAVQVGLADSTNLLQVDAEYLREGLATIREEPVRAFLLDPLRRIPRLWISMHHVQLSPWVGQLAAAACIGYLLLAAAGAWMLRHRFGEWSLWLVLPFAVTLAYAALHAEARYTLPARPVLWFLGGVALAAIAERIAARRNEKASVTPR
jgi:4-amino-4-deoxy-L-arabinose transferase-like glycosyltransferase